MAKKRYQKLRGMADILPADIKFWRHVVGQSTSLAELFGFQKISTPIAENTELFKRGVGDGTDIVEKEMYSFLDKGGDSITLHPEMTAPVVRAFLENGMESLPVPVKLYYVEPNFRYERPQSGRLRQHYQFGVEIIGDSDPTIDALGIIFAYRNLERIGLKNFIVELNSIGDPNCRKKYIKELVLYYEENKKNVCSDCKNRLQKNPLRVLDCKNEECQKTKEGAPNILDFLCLDCKTHFQNVIEYLEEAEISYDLNPFLVRGLDYYTKTVFEIVPKDSQKSQAALASGGRYDELVELLGGKPTPAFGFGMGIERAILKLKEENFKVPEIAVSKVFVAQLGKKAKARAIKIVDSLLREGIGVESQLSRDSISVQLKFANKANSKLAVIVGEREVVNNTVLIKDLSSGIQDEVPLKNVAEEVKKRLPR